MDSQGLITSITTLTNELARFEREYGIGSEAFYELYSQGKLDDGDSEQTAAFCEWAGLYQLKVKRERQLHRRLAQLLSEKCHLPAVVLPAWHNTRHTRALHRAPTSMPSVMRIRVYQ